MYYLCDSIKNHYSIVNQLERSSTSIGANIREANYAHGKADFVAKRKMLLKIFLKQSSWIELFYNAEIIKDHDLYKSLIDKSGTIRRVLIASINTAKINT